MILAVGVLVVGITEGIIIHASFGNPEEPVDYVVVLGAKVNRDGPSVSLWDRICAAYTYLDEHPDVTAVLSGGQGTDEPITEAECMYRELVNLGIDPQRLWMEEDATSTWENLNFSLDLIEEKTGARPRKLGVVSSEYHLYRASRFAKACGVEFVGIPAKTSRLSQKINHFMREVAGVWHYIFYWAETMINEKYADYAWEQTAALLAIDSPSGFTRRAAEWVKTAFEALGFPAKITTKGGVLADLGGENADDGLFSGSPQ